MNKFLKDFLSIPKDIFKFDKLSLPIWFVFSVIIGFFGPIFSFFYNDIAFDEIIVNECENNTFYTFSIAIIGSAIGGIVLQIIEEAINEDKSKTYIIILVIFLIICILVWISDGFSYAKHSIISTHIKKGNEIEGILSSPQIYFLMISLVLAIYSYSLSFLEKYPICPYLCDRTYAKRQEKKVDELIQEKEDLNDPLV